MKKHKSIVLIFSIPISTLFLSCDDSGVMHGLGIKGTINLQQYNFKHLDEAVDGYYELWIRLDSSGIGTYYSCGKFNISFDGSITDLAGGQMTFKFTGDTNNLFRAAVALITVEQPGSNNNFPGPAHLISTQLASNQDSIYGTLTLSGADALGSAGGKLMYVQYGSPNHGAFELMTPTGTQFTCARGVWFGDQNESFLPDGISLPGNLGWVYEGWVADITNPSAPIYYSTGRFLDPKHADFDSAGPCRGTNPSYDKPGQDWVDDNCSILGKPKITNLRSEHYQVLITLEPKYELPGSISYESPFFVVLFMTPINPLYDNCYVKDMLINRVGSCPKARININN